jgi:hypothetical protein
MINVGMIEIETPPKEVDLWLDDIRPMPTEYNYHCKTANEAIAILKLAERGVCRLLSVSLDHDLGADCFGTGYDVACEIEKMASFGLLSRLQWAVHSMNPVGRERIYQALESADRSWEKV